MRQPLSQDLLDLCQEETSQAGLTVNELLHRTEGRGLYLVFVLLSLPFITPVPLPGVSTVIGVIILFMALRLALGLPPGLPRFLGDRSLPLSRQQKLIQLSLKFVRMVEKISKPRHGLWMRGKWFQCLNGAILAAMGCLLIIPFPPLIFFTNSLPAWAIILVAASLVEEDGFLIWLGWFTAALATAYISFLIFGGTKLMLELIKRYT